MKLHYIVALVLLIFAGLSVYQGFHDGEMGRPTWIIAFLFFAPIALFYEKLKRWLMPTVVAFPNNLLVTLMLIVVGGMLIRGIIIGDGQEVVGWSASLIGLGVYLLLRGKMKVRSWFRFIPFIAMGVLILLEMFIVEPKKEQFPKKSGESQKPSVIPESTSNSDSQVEARPVLNEIQQKGLNILTSEEVQAEIKAAADTGNPPEFLESFSKFKDYMISKGMTEFAGIDQAPSQHFQELFQKQYPGKTPSDLDMEMRRRLIDMIQEFGYNKGRQKFLSTREIGIWAAARFNLLSDNQESITAWIDGVYTGEWEDTTDAPGAVSPPPVVSQEVLPFGKTNPDLPSAETENVPLDRASTALGADSAIPDTHDRSVTPPAVEAEKVVTEVSPQSPTLTEAEFEASLKQRFSKDRFARAMDTLNRYGEEGLRRLKEEDPEVAKRIEQHRNRSRSEDSDKSEEEDSK